MLRVLIVDDEVEVRRRIGQLLEELGFRVAEAGSAEEALAQLSSGVWDLLSPSTSACLG
jgi:CheY-like chemotaxis protein